MENTNIDALRALRWGNDKIDQPEESVDFLLSDHAAYITGQTWWVNGGLMMA